MEYEMRTLSVIILPKGLDIFHEMATTIEIEDEGGGEFLKVSQCRMDTQSILIDPNEWPHIRKAIDIMMKKIKPKEDCAQSEEHP